MADKSRDERGDRDKDKERKRRRHDEDDDRDKRHEHRRDRDRERDRERERPAGRDGRERKAVEITHSVMIKGLPSHTTEPALYAALAIFSPKEIRLITQREGGECKGFSFAEFHTVEHAQYFMSNYPGSWVTNCDPNGPQLIIENRAVLLEYARDRSAAGDYSSSSTNKERGFSSSSSGVGGVSHGQSDWLCSACSCHNFARREQCFRCSAPRPAEGEASLLAPSSSATSNTHGNNNTLSLIASDSPTVYLVVRGFNQQTVREEHLTELLRQFAVVKHTLLLPAGDPTTHYSTGMAFVQFHTVEHAAYTLKCLQDGGGLFIDQNQLQVHFAKEAMMLQLIQHQSHPLFAASAAASLPTLTAATPSSSSIAVASFNAATAAATLLPPSSSSSAHSAAATAAAAALQAAQWSMNNAFTGHSTNNITNMMLAPTQPPPPLYPHHPPAPLYPAKPKKSKWPPTFESSGSAYVFQARSGYFLEPTTNFYFCPKSKLYFDGHDGLYFRFKPTHTPEGPAVELVEPPLPCETDTATASNSSSSVSNPAEKKSMVIKLNPIKLTPAAATSSSGFSMNLSSSSSSNGSSSSGIVTAAAATSVVGGKKVLKDILKWGALQKEEEEEEELAQREKEREKASRASHSKQSKREVPPLPAAAGETGPPPPPPPAVSSAIINATTAAATTTTPAVAAVPATKAAAAVCLLCRRQFPSQEVLQRHERESKLHLDNLKLLLEKQKQTS